MKGELMMTPLAKEFRRIKDEHRHALKVHCARTTLGPSIMRVYTEGSQDALFRLLRTIEVDELPRIADQDKDKAKCEYNAWFDGHVQRLARVIDRHNPRNSRIRPGLTWGHAAKVMAIFVRGLVLHSRYFSDAEARRITLLLHAPIDSIVIARLRKLGASPPFAKLKDIDTRGKFYEVQDTLEKAASSQKVPRVWFDDNWGDRQ